MTDISAVDHRSQPGSINTIGLVSEASVSDYLALMKPRVMSLVVFTAWVGLAVAPAHVHPVIAFTALLCIAVGAGAAGALNMWVDADIDAVMTRTARRPIPRGRVTPGEALAFGTTNYANTAFQAKANMTDTGRLTIDAPAGTSRNGRS